MTLSDRLRPDLDQAIGPDETIQERARIWSRSDRGAAKQARRMARLGTRQLSREELCASLRLPAQIATQKGWRSAMRADDVQTMMGVSLFEGVARDLVEEMLRASFLQRFPSHVELVREGEPADFLHVVIEGHVEVFSGYRDRETTVAVVGPGHCFIIAAVLMDRVYLKSVRGLTQTRILMIPAEAVRRVFEQDAVFARHMALELAGAYRTVVKELKNQKLRSSLERLANWILSHQETIGSDEFELPFDKKVLASRLGMVPEVLSRSFATLAQYHVIVTGRQITIGDLESLRKLAHPCPTIDDPDV